MPQLAIRGASAPVLLQVNSRDVVAWGSASPLRRRISHHSDRRMKDGMAKQAQM